MVMCGHCHRHHGTPYDVYLCSRNARGSHRRQAQAQVTATTSQSYDPYPYPFKLPQALVEAIRDGRYAVDIGNDRQRVIFLRVSRPNTGRLRGCLKIQTQHSDAYKEAVIKYPSGQWRVHTNYLTEVERALTTVAVNPLDAAILYAKEKGVCARCGKELTDERSRYYHIGPECEKHWPDMITKINSEKGPF